MKAAVFDGPGRPLRIAEIARPVAGAGQLLLRVARCGVCGSDMQGTAEGSALPAGAVIGHEFCGVVAEIGEGVSGWAPGERAVAMPYIGCGECPACRAGEPLWCKAMRTHAFGQVSGGFGQYVAVAAAFAVRIADAVSWDQAAMVEPLAVGRHGLRRAGFSAGMHVLVLGAGPVGLATAMWARDLGAGHVAIAAASARKADLVRELGIDTFLTAEQDIRREFRARTGAPIDLVLECSGAPGALQHAISLVRARGRVGVVAGCAEPDPIRPKDALRKELSLSFALGYSLADFRESAERIARGDLPADRMITDRVTLPEFPAAFAALRHPTHQCKVLLCHED